MDQGLAIMILLSFLIGLAAGYLSGLLGIGAGVIMVPSAMYLLHMEFTEAKSISLFVIMFSSCVGMLRFSNHGKLDTRTGLMLGIPGAGGSFLGVYVAGIMDVTHLKVLFAMVLFFTGIRLIASGRSMRLAFRGRGNPAPSTAGAEPPSPPPAGIEEFIRHRRALPFIGLSGGFIAGLLGIGGGVIMVPAMIFLGYPVHAAVANSLMVVFLNATAGTVAHACRGEIFIFQAVPLMLGAVISVRKGADMSVSMNRDLLRKVFGYFMILIGVYMIFRSLFS